MAEEKELNEDQEFFEHHRLVVDEGQSTLRIDKFLINRLENISRNKIQMAAKADCVLVNNNPVKSNYKVKPRDVISIVLTHPPREIELIPQNIPVKIVYEDDDIIVVDKEAGMVVHPAYGNYSGTLVNALLYHLQQHSKQKDEEAKPYLVHRIDKNTSGILLVAKNELAQTRLAKEFFDHTIKRIYTALVWGDLTDEAGTITGNLGRDPKNRKMMTVFPEGDHGKHAITHYKVIERLGYVSLVECILETGRTHQIRTHFKYIGHPIFNDSEYGGDAILKGTTFTKYKQFVNNCFKIIPRQALHARYLGFKHPVTGKFLEFNSELSGDMQEVIDKWRKYAKYSDIE